jgi:hypothetical protein
MAKPTLVVDKNEFQQVVYDLESKATFANPSYLWKAVEATAWAKAQLPRPLTASVAYVRAKELGIITKTKGGKRGVGTLSPEHKAAMQAGRGQRKPRAEKMQGFTTTFKGLKEQTPTRWLPVVEKAEAGSLRAAISLKCLDCTCFQPKEIADCRCVECSLFPHRPYKK